MSVPLISVQVTGDTSIEDIKNENYDLQIRLVDILLEDALVERNLVLADYLIQSGGSIEAYKSTNTYTPLEWAIHKQQFDVVKFLVEHGANISRKAGRWRYRPMNEAILSGNFKIMEYLVTQGCICSSVKSEYQGPGVDLVRKTWRLQKDEYAITLTGILEKSFCGPEVIAYFFDNPG